MSGYTPEEIAGLNDYHESMDFEFRAAQHNRSRILRAIKSVKGLEFHDAVLEEAEDSEADSYAFWELVREPIGDPQESRFYPIKTIWVEQWSVGDSGDSWEGYVCIQLKPNLYLKFHYAC